MNYNELTPVQKHVVRAMHYIWLSKKPERYIWKSPQERLFECSLGLPEKLDWIYKRWSRQKDWWIHKRAYENECLRLAEIPKRIPGYTNEKARREAKDVVDYVRAKYRRMKC